MTTGGSSAPVKTVAVPITVIQELMKKMEEVELGERLNKQEEGVNGEWQTRPSMRQGI